MDSEIDIQRLAPEKQLELFSKAPLFPNIILAIVAHVLLIGLLSVGFIIGYFNPPAPEPEKKPETPSTTGSASSGSSSGAASASSGSSSGGAASSSGSGSSSGSHDPRLKNKEYIENLNKSEPPPKDLGKNVDESLQME